MILRYAILFNGGDLVSTWVTKLEVHVEEVTYPRKKMLQKQIVAKFNRNFAKTAVNDTNFGGVVTAAAA